MPPAKNDKTKTIYCTNVDIITVCGADTCVNDCHRKADCDPGSFGSDYVKFEECPLNGE